METNVRDIILNALENKGFYVNSQKKIIFVDDEDTNNDLIRNGVTI